MNRCVSLCVAKRIDFNEVGSQFSGLDRGVVYQNTLHLEIAGGHAFIFEYGVLVLWGLSVEAERALHRKVVGFCISPHPDPIYKEFTFDLDAEHNRIHADHISLMGHEPLRLLAASHGIAQSSKLEEWEVAAHRTIEEYSYLARNLAATGSMKETRKNKARIRGRLFLLESEINRNYDSLAVPAFFREYQTFKELHTITTRYFDIDKRVRFLDRKLTIIDKLFLMLADEQKDGHDSVLEWLIILLTGIVLMFFIANNVMSLI